MGEVLQDYSLTSIVDCCKKIFTETKKIGNPNNKGNEQVKNKKTTINNKIMQTQQCKKWT